MSSYQVLAPTEVQIILALIKRPKFEFNFTSGNKINLDIFETP